MKPFIKRTFPFSALEEGQNAVQVGSAAWTLEAGISHTLMLSVIVGRSGNVLVIEPEKENVRSLRKYIDRNMITNVSIVEKAVWSKAGEKTLSVFDDATGGHTMTEVLQRKFLKKSNRAKKTTLNPAKEIDIEVDTLENILKSKNYFCDYVNLTINGAECEAILGMGDILAENVTVTFPIFGPREWFNFIFGLLTSKGYKIVVCDAPPTLRGPGIDGIKRKLKRRSKFPQRLVACAIKEKSRAKLGKEYQVKLERIEPGGEFKIIPSQTYP